MRDFIPWHGMKSRIEPKSFFWGQANPGLAPWAALTRAFSPRSKPVSMVTAFGGTLTKQETPKSTASSAKGRGHDHEKCG